MLTKQQPNQEKLNEEDTKCEESQQPKKRKIITKKQPSVIPIVFSGLVCVTV